MQYRLKFPFELYTIIVDAWLLKLSIQSIDSVKNNGNYRVSEYFVYFNFLFHFFSESILRVNFKAHYIAPQLEYKVLGSLNQIQEVDKTSHLMKRIILRIWSNLIHYRVIKHF